MAHIPTYLTSTIVAVNNLLSNNDFTLFNFLKIKRYKDISIKYNFNILLSVVTSRSLVGGIVGIHLI